MSQSSRKVWTIVLKTICYVAAAVAGAFGLEISGIL